jgi:thiol-disulfide isomerase/thioredoxin
VTHDNNPEKGAGAFRPDQSQLVFSQGFSFSGYERDGVYLNLTQGKFLEISGVSGLDSISDGRAAVFADFDNDGANDVFLTTIQGPAHLLFRNNLGQQNHFLRIALEGGVKSGRDAFGTVVSVKTSAGILTKIKAGGMGFLSQHDPRLLFGLGEDQKAKSIEVTWPHGRLERFDGDFSAGNFLLLREGTGKAETVPLGISHLPDSLTPAELFARNLKVQIGQPFPPLDLKSLGNGLQNLESIRQPNRRLLINLWATWCLPCRKEMPELNLLKTGLAAHGIDLIGLNVDADHHLESIRTFLEKTPVNYPIYIGGQQSIGQIYSSDELTVPLSLLLDKKGIVEKILPGWNAATQREFRALAEK